MSLLSVESLAVEYRSSQRIIRAVDGVTFEVQKGEVFGLVGESGSGKSTVARALMRLLPRNGAVRDGAIAFEGVDVLGLGDRAWRELLWERIAMVFQGAINALDPVYRIDAQISEAIRTHRPAVGRREARLWSERLLARVGIDPARGSAYPHELSGGMKQRVSIAMAMALEPDLIIADEPTTALDVITQDDIIGKLVDVHEDQRSALILITHDMGLIAENCDRVAVMYAGEIVELGSVDDVFACPAHPYTMGLIAAIPKGTGSEELVAIPGSPPTGDQSPVGCRFAPRCPFKEAVCEQRPPREYVGPGHEALCHFSGDRIRLNELARRHETWAGSEVGRRSLSGAPGGASGEVEGTG